MYDQFSYIIPYRKSSEDRESALNFTIGYMNKHFPDVEVIVVEQDAAPRDHNLDGKFRLVFSYNPGLFNRSWGMNCGAVCSSRPYVVFADNDVFMSVADYATFFNAILDENIDVVTPAGITINNPEVKKVKNIRIIGGKDFNCIEELEERDRWTYAMMLILFKKERLFEVGGWFEEFEGWGAEDNAMDELIQHSLTPAILNLQLYHIDHGRSVLDGNKQPNYEKNVKILEQIKKSFRRDPQEYVEKRRALNRIFGMGDVNKYKKADYLQKVEEIKELLGRHTQTSIFNGKTKRCVLAITTFNRVDYLHAMLVSFLQTRNNFFNWEIVVADDGSTDDTRSYLEQLSQVWPGFHIIFNERRGVAHQFNSIVQKLDRSRFDICFKCDDDILFMQSGWDALYAETIEETGYDHLCYYYRGWRADIGFNEPVIKDVRLVAYCEKLHIQGAFFTLTPSIIRAVGYMDAKNFAPRAYEHVDYSLRCGRAGFNDTEYIYDVLGSNDFLWLNYDQNYKSTVPINELYAKLSPPERNQKKLGLLADASRIYVPYNESPKSYDDQYMLELSYSVIEDLKQDIKSLKQHIAATKHDKVKNDQVAQVEQIAGYSDEEWLSRYRELKSWYHKEYEVLPLWYKRFGHIIKVVKGKRTVSSLFK